jgi:hypothetical protein
MSYLSFDSSNFPQKQKDAEIERRQVKSYQGFLYLCGLILEAGDLDAITACLRHGSGVDALGGLSEGEALGWPPWREVGETKEAISFRGYLPRAVQFKAIPQLPLQCLLHASDSSLQ